jgi:hypothetical protein
MLDRTPKWVWFALGLTLLIGFSVLVGYSSAQPPHTRHAQAAAKAPEYKSAQDISAEIVAYYTEVLAWFTAIMAVATIGLGVGTYFQIKLARNEFNSTHRPKIRLKHLWLGSDIFLENEPITVNLMCVNTGTAIGTLGQVGIRCHVVGNERSLPADPSIAATLRLSGAPPLGVNWAISNLNTARVLTAQERMDIQRGTAKLYCVGWISYGHTAQGIRITGFCRKLEAPEGKAALTTANGRFRVCEHPDYEYQD